MKNNDTKDYSEQLEFLTSEPYYASKKIVNHSSDFPVRRTGSYRHKKALTVNTVNHLGHGLRTFTVNSACFVKEYFPVPSSGGSQCKSRHAPIWHFG